MIWGGWSRVGGNRNAGAYTLSESGNSVYQLTESGLVVFDELVSEDQLLIANQRVIPFAALGPFTTVPRGGDIAFADDDILLFIDAARRLQAIDLDALGG